MTPAEDMPEELVERIAQIPWRIQQLRGEDAYEHRVRVVQEVLDAVEKAEDDMYGIRERVEPARPAEFTTDGEWASYLWGRMHEACDEAADLRVALDDVDRALASYRTSQERP